MNNALKGRGRGRRVVEPDLAPVQGGRGQDSRGNGQGQRGNGRGYALRGNGGFQEPVNGQRELEEVRAGGGAGVIAPRGIRRF